MSICVTVNLDVKLTGLPDNVVEWFNFLSTIKNSSDYDKPEFNRLTPKELLDADRMLNLNTNYWKDDISFYKFKEIEGGYRLRLIKEQKNRNEDAEKFINFLIPYIVNYENNESIIIINYDSDMVNYLVDIDKTYINSIRDELITVALDEELQYIDYDDVEFIDTVRTYLNKISKELDNVR